MPDSFAALGQALADRYDIQTEVGSGGMATVYLAHDVKHDRRVAVKVLRPELAALIGADRFLNEIKVTANLGHPNILQLYDSGEAGGFLYYVMPFVEGESLREKLHREKQLPIEETLEIAKAVASALDYAHGRGVIHRDIKPENILLQHGQPVVADFGIALAVSAAGGHRLTETGLSIGTPHYMSPEQAMGDRDVDARSDVYSLAATVFEMLVGEPPFTGPTAQAIVAKVITEAPSKIVGARPTVPRHVEATVQKGLAKLPADRFGSASAFAAALTNPLAVAAEASAPLARTWTTRTPLVPWTVAAVAVLGAVTVWLTRPNAAIQGSQRWSIVLPDSAEVALQDVHPLNVQRMTLAPLGDGSGLVYTGWDGTQRRLYRRSLGSFAVSALPGTAGGMRPISSPDGTRIAFFTSADLRTLALRGGDPRVLSGSANPMSGSWTAETLVYSDIEGSVLRWIPASGGRAELLSDTTNLEGWIYHDPSPLPGGEVVLVHGRNPPTIVAFSLTTGEHTIITEGATPLYLPSGHVMFARGSTLYAARFDLDALAIVGEAIPVVSDVYYALQAHYAVSRDGTLYFVPGQNTRIGRLAWVDRTGGVEILPVEPREFQRSFVSPDGTKVAFWSWSGGEHISVFDLQRRNETRVTDGATYGPPIWSPDGSEIVYSEPAEGSLVPNRLVRRSLLRTGVTHLTTTNKWTVADAWSPDGEWILVSHWGPGGGDIHRIHADSGGPLQPVVATPANEWGASISPDGMWIAYTTDIEGNYQVYAEPYPPTGRNTIKISTHENSEEPQWSPDGREIYYRNGDRFWAVPIRQAEPRLDPGPPQLVFQGPYLNIGGRSFDVHPEGGRFLVIAVPEARTASRINVITNWFAEVERLVP